MYEWTVADRIIEECGDALFYDWAIQAFADHAYLERFTSLHPGEVDITTYQHARVVAGEIRKREKQEMLNQRAEAQARARERER